MRSTILLLFLLSCSTIYAQWNSNASINNPVCNFTGSQTNLQMVSDGTGGAITVWQDSRNGATDIYAQRISATGALLWAVDGVPLCIAAFNQQNPRIVTDGTGGAVISWMDDRNGAGAGNYDIYAQRINANGIVQWDIDGLPVCTATGIQNNHQMLADNSGAMIVWSDGRGGSSNADIYAQRLNQVGTPLWTLDGIAVCTATSLQNVPQIISDGGAGSAIVAWEDWRNFSQSDIYAQRISNGFTTWAFNGVVICSEPNFAHQYNTKMVMDGSGGAIMCWEDKRNFGSNTDLYAQRVSSSGIVQWTANGVPVCTASGIQFSHQLITDASGGAVIAWEDRRAGRDIYTQKINASGAAQWAANGIVVCNDPNTQEEPQLVTRASGGAVFLWTDSRNSFQQDIYTQAMDAAGNPLWIANGVAVANEAHAQFTAQLISDGADGAIIAWQDLRTTLDYDIYSSKLFASGTLPLQLLSFTGTAEYQHVLLRWNTENEINTAHFDIEFSTDGISFYKLGTVNAKNTSGSNQYSFTDASPAADILFYRLKQVDINGRTEYSTSIKIILQKNTALYVYPNPATNYIQLKHNSATTFKQLQVIDGTGRIILSPVINNMQQYNVTSLKAGTYFIRIIKQDRSTTVIPFTKQ